MDIILSAEIIKIEKANIEMLILDMIKLSRINPGLFVHKLPKKVEDITQVLHACGIVWSIMYRGEITEIKTYDLTPKAVRRNCESVLAVWAPYVINQTKIIIQHINPVYYYIWEFYDGRFQVKNVGFEITDIKGVYPTEINPAFNPLINKEKNNGR